MEIAPVLASGETNVVAGPHVAANQMEQPRQERA